ncbi:MAG: YceI family protein, partial [Litoreibacter sp.]|nr:YceI family protein [Litoreibacter sp.]
MPVATSDIAIDLQNLTRSRVDVTVDVRRAKTGFFFATEALKGASVLNAKAYPTIRFTSTRVRLNGSGRLSDGAKIDGNLTIRGVTRPVTLNAALFRQRGTDPSDLSRLSFRLNGTLSRKAFGVNGYPKLVDDTIKLDIVARVKR